MAVFPRFLFYCWPQFLLLAFFSYLNTIWASGCYYADNSTVLSSPDYVVPCGDITSTTSPFLNCCALQSNNICLSSSLCYDPNQVGGAYYLSPCTDKTYSAPECPQYCSMSFDFQISPELKRSIARNLPVLTIMMMKRQTCGQEPTGCYL